MQMNFEAACRESTIRLIVSGAESSGEKGNIHLLGSDMHRLDYRPPEIKESS